MSFTNPTFPDVDPDTFLRKPLNFDSPRDTPRFCQSSQACLVNLSCTSTPVTELAFS
jgi:hypothetical protein